MSSPVAVPARTPFLDNRGFRAGEALVLCALWPVLIWSKLLPPYVFFLAQAVWAVSLLLRDPGFRFRDLLRLPVRDLLRRETRRILLQWASVTVLLVASLAWIAPERLFILPREMPGLLALILLLYPFASALPQTLFFRAYFVRRYSDLFPKRALLLVGGALAFGWAHLLMNNAVGLALAVPAGALFLWTYLRSGSFVLSWLEHALYGNTVFFVGWGWFFYYGAYN